MLNRNEKDWKNLLTYIKIKLEEKGITQLDISNKTGKLPSAISNYFNYSNPSTLFKFIRAAGFRIVLEDESPAELYKGIRLSKKDPEGHKKAIDYITGENWRK